MLCKLYFVTMPKKRFVLLFLIFFPYLLMAQQNNFSRFKELSAPEKRWIAFHPIVAQKALQLSIEAQKTADSLSKHNILDNQPNGGQLDAFRHGYWMANLTVNIGSRKAFNLGKAHEKGNKADFRKGILEEGELPDTISMEMDLYNNKIGVNIGKANKNKAKYELQQLIIESVISGKFKIISRDDSGNFLDTDGNIVPEEQWKGFWENKRCLVNSNVIGN